MARILLVDDERVVAWAMRYSLSDDGHEVFAAYDGVEALALAERHRPDLIILDIMLPRLDGLEVCRTLRRDASLAAVPILFLTARTAIQDRVAGLDQGGDDYLTKPFDAEELKARVRALLRRGTHPAASNHPSLLAVGDLTLEPRRAQVQVRGVAVKLTPTELALLRYLMIHPGEIISGRELLQQVWGHTPGTVRSSLVRWHIRNLRAKIEPDPRHPLYIRTLPRYGYILRDHPTTE